MRGEGELGCDAWQHPPLYPPRPLAQGCAFGLTGAPHSSEVRVTLARADDGVLGLILIQASGSAMVQALVPATPRLGLGLGLGLAMLGLGL